MTRIVSSKACPSREPACVLAPMPVWSVNQPALPATMVTEGGSVLDGNVMTQHFLHRSGR